MAVTTPAAPTYTVEPLPDKGTVRINVRTTANTGSGGRQFIEVQVSRDVGSTWLPLRWGKGIERAGVTTPIHDDECPTQLPMLYRVRAVQDDGSSQAATGWVSNQPPAILETVWWFLTAPYLPGYRLRLFVPRADRAYTRAQPKTDTQVPGRANPVTRYGTREGRSGSLTFELRSNAESDLLDMMLEAQTPLFVSQPNGRSYYVTVGDATITEIANQAWAGNTHTRVALAYRETGVPA